ncbi:hypothetical protein LINPERPRIM_LOCUS30707 [Linum perenne]
MSSLRMTPFSLEKPQFSRPRLF